MITRRDGIARVKEATTAMMKSATIVESHGDDEGNWDVKQDGGNSNHDGCKRKR
jgi:hypothetical protein